MKRIPFIIILSSLIFSFSGCQQLFLGEIEPNTVMNNFEVFGKDIKEKYGLLQVRNINWDALLEQYRTELEANPTEEKLYHVLTSLLDSLDDSHTGLYDPTLTFPSYEGGIYGRLERAEFVDFDLNLVVNKYLNLIDSVQDRIYYGTLEGNIGYVYLPEIYDEPSFFESYMPSLISDLADTKGIIIDIRDNNGGEDESSKMIASFFADERHLFMISKYKTGPGPNDFEEPRKWYVEPPESSQYLKPVALLTNRYSVSAAETFSLAMKTFPHVTHLGDTTTGAFSDAVTRQLPNGWAYSISVGDYRDANNISHEGIGLIPDILVENNKEDLENRTDNMLEAAIQAL